MHIIRISYSHTRIFGCLPAGSGRYVHNKTNLNKCEYFCTNTREVNESRAFCSIEKITVNDCMQSSVDGEANIIK